VICGCATMALTGLHDKIGDRRIREYMTVVSGTLSICMSRGPLIESEDVHDTVG
jgi:hypothetical protein